MQPNDFVFSQIYKGALKSGATERFAHRHAVMGLEDYKKSKIATKVSKLIEQRIKDAIKDTKRAK
jgi:hypothetical protein